MSTWTPPFKNEDVRKYYSLLDVRLDHVATASHLEIHFKCLTSRSELNNLATVLKKSVAQLESLRLNVDHYHGPTQKLHEEVMRHVRDVVISAKALRRLELCYMDARDLVPPLSECLEELAVHWVHPSSNAIRALAGDLTRSSSLRKLKLHASSYSIRFSTPHLISISNEDFASLAEALGTISTLTALELECVMTPVQITALGNLLERNKSIVELGLSDLETDVLLRLVNEILQKESGRYLRKLGVRSWDTLTMEHHELLASGLANCSSLAELDLSRADVTDECLRCYAAISTKLPSLKRIRVGGRRLSLKNPEHLLAMIENCPLLCEVHIRDCVRENTTVIYDALLKKKNRLRATGSTQRVLLDIADCLCGMDDSDDLRTQAYFLGDPLREEEDMFMRGNGHILDEERMMMVAATIEEQTTPIPNALRLKWSSMTPAVVAAMGRALGNPRVRSRRPDGAFDVVFAPPRHWGEHRKDVSPIIAAMKTNPHFSSLDLLACGIGDEGIEAWCDYFRSRGRREVEFLFRETKMTRRGLNAIMDMMRDPRFDVCELSLVHEENLTTEDVVALARCLVEHGSRTLRRLLLRTPTTTDEVLRILGEGLHLFSRLNYLWLTATSKFHKLTGGGFQAVLRGHEASMGPPRELSLGHDGTRCEYLNFLYDYRRRFRFVLVTSPHAPNVVRRGGMREAISLVCDYFVGYLVYDEHINFGQWTNGTASGGGGNHYEYRETRWVRCDSTGGGRSGEGVMTLR